MLEIKCEGCKLPFHWSYIDAAMEVREAERAVYLCGKCLNNVLTYLSTLKETT